MKIHILIVGRGKFATKEDLFDMEERLGNRRGNRIDHLEDDMRMVKSRLKLS